MEASGKNGYNLQVTRVYISWMYFVYLYLDRQLHPLQRGSLCFHHTLCLQGHTGPQGTETPLGHTRT